MLSCVKKMNEQQRLLTKHRRNRKLVKDLLSEADECATPGLEDSWTYVLRFNSIRDRLKKALEILERTL